MLSPEIHNIFVFLHKMQDIFDKLHLPCCLPVFCMGALEILTMCENSRDFLLKLKKMRRGHFGQHLHNKIYNDHTNFCGMYEIKQLF